MNKPQTKHELSEELLQDHEHLGELLGRIHRILGDRQETVVGVAEVLASFGEHVERHFAEEETAGFFDDVVDRAPWLSNRIDALRTEHQQFLNAVGRLNEVAVDGDGSADWFQRLEVAFHEFSSELMHHESAENAILLEAYTNDIGAAD
jgi:iron-sulfur cluster repair protein YtfE (RIC family)